MEENKKTAQWVVPVLIGLFGSLLILILAVLMLGMFAVFTMPNAGPGGMGGKSLFEQWLFGEEQDVVVVTESQLKEILNVSELSVMSVDYSAIAKKYDAEERDLQYCVSYDGTVTMGIDFSKVEIETKDIYMDGEDKVEVRTFIVRIPECEITDVAVDFGSMDYIFVDKTAETESVSSEAYELCRQDLDKRVRNERELKELAKKNVIEAISALLEPWMAQVDDRCEIQIEYGSKYEE